MTMQDFGFWLLLAKEHKDQVVQYQHEMADLVDEWPKHSLTHTITHTPIRNDTFAQLDSSWKNEAPCKSSLNSGRGEKKMKEQH